jgi:hypothetical protein
MLWAQQISNCLAKLKEMIAILLKFMLHFKMGGGASVVARPGRHNPQLRHLLTYSMQPSSSWEANWFSLVKKFKNVVYSVLTSICNQ